MKSKAVFVIGAGLGYLFGTKAGRERFEQIKGWANQTWNDPKVQSKVSDLESTATRFAKDQGGAIAGKVKERISGSKGETGSADTSSDVSSAGTSSTGTSSTGTSSTGGWQSGNYSSGTHHESTSSEPTSSGSDETQPTTPTTPSSTTPPPGI